MSVVASAFADVDVSGGIKMYGVIDQAVQTQTLTDPQASTSARTANGMYAAAATSRLGFKGARDLEDGTKAKIQFEIALAPDTPKALLPASNRQAFVGLENKEWGEIRLGTQETTAYEVFSYDANGRVEYKPQLWRLTSVKSDTYAMQDRAGNSVKYISPEFKGVTFHAMVGYSETSNELTTGQDYVSLGLKIHGDNYKAAWIADRLSNAIGSVCLPGSNCTDGVFYDGKTNNTASTNYAQWGGSSTSDVYRQIGAFTYDFTSFSLHYIYAKAYTTSTYAGDITTQTVGVRIPFNKVTVALSAGSGNLNSGITQTSASVGAKTSGLNDITLGAYYNFDKSTQAYFLGSNTTVASGYKQAGSVVSGSTGVRFNF